MPDTLLRLEQVTVSFDGFKAIQELSFQVTTGTIRVLIGPNGAGKSTMCDAVIGKVRLASGKIIFKGMEISQKSEHAIANMGICRKFQTPGVLENLTVHDNLAVAVRKNKHWFANLKPRLDPIEEQRLEELITMVGLEERRTFPAGQLAHGEKQWLEIGMVVAANPELLLLDEPTAGMTAQETEKTAELIRKLSGQHTILVIDHDMHFVELLQAPVSVLHQGQLFAEGSIEEIRENPKVVEIYLGRAKGDTHARA